MSSLNGPEPTRFSEMISSQPPLLDSTLAESKRGQRLLHYLDLKRTTLLRVHRGELPPGIFVRRGKKQRAGREERRRGGISLLGFIESHAARPQFVGVRVEPQHERFYIRNVAGDVLPCETAIDGFIERAIGDGVPSDR